MTPKVAAVACEVPPPSRLLKTVSVTPVHPQSFFSI